MASEVSLGSVYGKIELRDEMQKGIDSAEKSLAGLTKSVEKRMGEVGGAFQKIGGVFTTSFTVPIVAGFGLAAKAAISFEDRLADVAKTTGLEGEALKKFGDDLRSYAQSTRTSLDDLLTISEIGGQLGIAQNELLGFVSAIDKFNVALGADFAGGVAEASAEVGKIQSLFKETRDIKVADSITKIGSAINDLGSKGAGTSANIAEFTLRLGALPDALKPTITDTLALGTVLEEMGIDAEVGSRSLSILLNTAATDIGGFAKQMKISAKEAAKLINTNPTEFLKKFADSLKGLSAIEVGKVLEDLKIGGDGAIKVLGALSTNTERLTELQKLSNDAFSDGTSLQAEYNKKNKTTQAELAKMGNNFNNLAITVGSVLLPIINELIQKVLPLIQGMVDAFGNLDPNIQKVVIVFLALLAAVGPLSLALGLIISSVGTLIGSFGVIATAVGALLSPVGLLVAGVAALGAAFLYLANQFGVFDKIKGLLEQVWAIVQNTMENIRKAFEDPAVQSAIQRVQDAFQRLKDSLAPIFNTINDFIQKIRNALSDAFGDDAAESSIISLEGAVKLLSGAFDGAAKVLDFFAQLVSKVIDLVKPLAGQWIAKLQEGWEKMQPALLRIQQAFEKIRPLLEFIGQVIATVGGIIGSVLIAQLNALFNAVLTIIPYIVDIFSNAFEFIANIVQFFVKLFSGDLPGALDSLGAAFGNIWNIIKGVFEGIFNTIKSYVEGFVGFFTSLNTQLGDIVGQISKKIQDSIRNMINTVLNWISGFVNGIVDRFNSIVGAVRNIFQGIYNGIRDAFQKAYDFVKGIVEGIKGIISNIFTAGANVAGSLANAFKSLINGVIDKVNKALEFKINVLGANIDVNLPDIPKFAGGGIVGGNSTSGDGILARLNSKEMILNRGQQANLFNALDSGTPLNAKYQGADGATGGKVVNVQLSIPVNGYIGTPMQLKEVAETFLGAIEDVAFTRGIDINVLGK